MTKLVHDVSGERRGKTGVSKGVHYKPTAGVYAPGSGVVWNGLTAVNESPSGAEATPFYADDMKYMNILSAEDFGCTIEAFMYPDQFAECEGGVQPQPGVTVTQQDRKSFGFSYQTKIVTDQAPGGIGYEIHLVWGALASPSEKSNATVNETPELTGMSWEVSTTPVAITTPAGLKPTAHMIIDSTKVGAANLTALENAIYGTAGADARLPLPEEVIAMFAGSSTLATPTQPTFVAAGGTATIPTITGVIYKRGDTNATLAAGAFVVPTIGTPFVIYAIPVAGYYFPPTVDDDWSFTRTS